MSVTEDETVERLPRGNQERVEFYPDIDSLWRFRWVGANNEIVAEGEGYQNHADALAAADAIFRPVPWYESSRAGVWKPVNRP